MNGPAPVEIQKLLRELEDLEKVIRKANQQQMSARCRIQSIRRALSQYGAVVEVQGEH
ncbi:hypothetical protein [Marinobacter sp. BGYM27]|uniref:hypothetical protein n=1 Tax=Marinobacter sp. BGYM27 TaxID=2975597 RepID=UPI0021A748D9|nr:hypothetical protein [Marinobacter sp. BGYM27]MDG5498944.1 hypothetical protein [Marinobacter sp. BGYM27]